MSDNFFAELEAEIAEANAAAALKSDAVKLRKTAHNMQLSPRQRAEAAAEFKAIQAIVEANMWEVVRSAAFFARQECDGCGSIHFNFLQFMQEERKVKDSRTRRWTRTALPANGLERETIIQPLKSHMCVDCAEEHGFAPNAPSIVLMPVEGSLTVSANYVQGDINDSLEEG